VLPLEEEDDEDEDDGDGGVLGGSPPPPTPSILLLSLMDYLSHPSFNHCTFLPPWIAFS
jgi:hypothetical protein